MKERGVNAKPMRNLIPSFIHNQFKRQNDLGRFHAVAMFVDISGFTHLTEALMEHEADGAEVLAEALNHIFGPPVAEVYARGGFISNFAGDAFTALFPVDKIEATNATLRTALFIRDFFAEHGLLETKYGQFEMGVKVGMSLGDVNWGIVGEGKRRAYFFRGPAIEGCVNAEGQAGTGDVIADDQIWPAVEDHVMAQAIQVAPPYFRLTDLVPSMPSPSNYPVPPALALTRQALSPFVSDAVLDLVSSGAQAEFRQVAAAFVSFEDPGIHTDVGTLTCLNAFVTAVLDAAADYSGYFNKLDFGDKGNLISFEFPDEG